MEDLGRELESFPYRPSWKVIVGSGGFFALCGLVLTHKARTEGSASLWLVAIAAWAFVVAGAALAILRLASSPRIVVAERGLIVPRGRWSKGAQGILLDEILSLEQRAVQGQVFLTITHAGGTFTLHRGSLPDRSDYDLILEFLRTRTWRGEADEAQPGLAARRALDSDEARARRGAGRALDSELSSDPPSWFRPAVKILTLLTFCGGPLYVSKVLEPHYGQIGAFMMGMAPVAVLAFVVLTVVEDRPLRPAPVLVWGGRISLGVILLESAVAALQVFTGGLQKDAGLILFGSTASVATAVIYRRLTRAN